MKSVAASARALMNRLMPGVMDSDYSDVASLRTVLARRCVALSTPGRDGSGLWHTRLPGPRRSARQRQYIMRGRDELLAKITASAGDATETAYWENQFQEYMAPSPRTA